MEAEKNDQERLAQLFAEHRGRLRAVSYRMLGSLSEADDAVQDAWLRFSRTDTSDVDNLASWLTTVVSRVCLNMLRARATRREEELGVHVPDPIVGRADQTDPAHEVLLADSVGLALLVVLQTLAPPERLAFVLHDLFDVPFEEIAPIVGRTPTATRQLASRARRRVQDGAPPPDPDLSRQREVVDAFFAAARRGDFDALVAVLDPDIVLRVDGGTARPETTILLRGASAVASRALTFAHLSPFVRPALINGAAGVVVAPDGRPFSIMAFTVRGGRVVAIDALVDPTRIDKLDFSAIEGG
jgi:RNA polymerase sigma factor (sigma-70 family)